MRASRQDGVVAAEDVARRADLDLFDEELGLASHPLNEQWRQRRFVVEHQPADDGAAANRILNEARHCSRSGIQWPAAAGSTFRIRRRSDLQLVEQCKAGADTT
jgi:hypothetical protein